MAAPVLGFYMCDMVTGLNLTDLPVTCDSAVCNLAQDNTATFNLPVLDSTCPPDWPSLLTPLSRMLVLTINDSPVQGWWIDEEPTVGESVVSFSGHTFEACAGTMNVPDVSGATDDAQAAYQMCTNAVLFDGASGTTVLPSLADRFGFTVTYTPSNTMSMLDYTSLQTTSVLSAMQDLMSQGRIEFRFGIQWNSARNGFRKTVEIGPRIGGVRPDAVFDLGADGGGTVATAGRASAGRGATMVIGFASLTGGTGSTTDPQIATALRVPLSSGGPGYPLVELRESYDNLSDSDDLDAALLVRTRSSLKRASTGRPVWNFKLKQDGDTMPGGQLFSGALQPGVDFQAGDTVTYDIAPRPVDPVGGKGVARLLGYTLNLADFSCTPTLWPDPDDN